MGTNMPRIHHTFYTPIQFLRPSSPWGFCQVGGIWTRQRSREQPPSPGVTRVDGSNVPGDYQPLDISYGEIGIFHGTLCRHHVPQNSSDFTRVSMDFRIGLGETWRPPLRAWGVVVWMTTNNNDEGLLWIMSYPSLGLALGGWIRN